MSNLSINETVNETVNIPTNEKVSNNQLVDSDDDSEEELPKKGLVGLNNQGNTCYLNSVIQTLSNLDYFRNYLFEGNFIQSLKPELDDSLFYQTYRIIKHLWETTSNDLTPKSFRKKFIEKENQFMGYNQQDSQEAMQFIIDNLHEEIAQSIEINSEIKPEYEAFFKLCDNYYENQAKIDVNNKNNETSNDKSILKLIDANPTMALDYFALKFYKELSKKYSEISELFQSIVCELNKCPDCNHISYRFQQNFMIQLAKSKNQKDLANFGNKVHTKAEEILIQVKTEEGQNAIKAYARHMEKIAKHPLGLKLLLLFKTFNLADYSVLRAVADVILGIEVKRIYDLKKLVDVVNDNYDAFEKLKHIIQLPENRKDVEVYSLMIQVISLAHQYEVSYLKFEQLMKVIQKWYRNYQVILQIYQEYPASQYKLPQEFSEPIPGEALYLKYCKCLTDKKTGIVYMDLS